MTVNGSGTLPAAQVGVIVIGFNDAAHIRDAVRSALAQGPAVAEVIAVDDASTDGTAAILDELADTDPRLRVVHRAANSGGCGTPRNDGVRAATAPYVMFLDSDDTLPEGAADALLGAALRHRAPVAAGLCVRRELPQRRDTAWQPALYRRPAVYSGPEARPALLRDTLCVNKLYARDFLTEHGIAFPEGRFIYEDFVFAARVMAAAPRVATVPDTVYIWHVRRDAAAPSISLDRERIANWQARVAAHRSSVEVFLDAGSKPLARAARVKFLDHDLRMYVRELPARSAGYRHAWWRVTRGYLAGFDEAELSAARPPARWIARVVLAAEAPRDLERLAQLAARPARLLPPYAQDAAASPVWSADLPRAALDGVLGPGAVPPHHLPVTVDAELRLTARARARLRLRVHDLYGRLATIAPEAAEVELRHRDGGPVLRRAVPLTDEGTAWTARVVLPLSVLAGRDRRDGAAPSQTWDVRVRVQCAGGAFRTTVRAVGRGLHRAALPSLRHGLLLARPYATVNGSLALRLASGARGAWAVAKRS
ncbi:glycosyltransferase family 2 protein [Streptomyces nondiastaticus]|uniref:glycosyltransferase family 2 protein n=1 Tax=Streptomyces sp. VNUA116 TaxID=3062449 RepID=UPI002675D924|nr:glycosyltransferase family 2 protein [Streptomyces sp. VNUA116]WKU45111.1 glycosyltransferase family 2 protein [Streptomyces sp. VNUA116]